MNATRGYPNLCIRITAGAVALAIATSFASAHPGSGVVVDNTGTIYFTDIVNTTIWKVDPSGNRSAFVRDTWTHSIQLDGNGTFYYERELNEPGVPPIELNRIKPDGTRETIIEAPRDRAQFSGTGFVQRQDGSTLFPFSVRGADGKWRAVIHHRSPKGTVRVFAGSTTGALYRDGPKALATFRQITDMTAGPDQSLYLLDRDRLRRIDRTGTVSTLATGLLDAKPLNPPETSGPETTINRLYGLAVSENGTTFIAYHAGRRVIKVTRNGLVTTLLKSEAPWAPIGVACAPNGVVVLEANDHLKRNGLRVRTRLEDGTIKTIAEVEGKNDD